MGPPDVCMHEGNRRRPDEGRHDDQVLEHIGLSEPVGRHPPPEFAQQEPRRRRFDVEAADGVSPPDQVLCRVVIQRIPRCIVQASAGVPFDGVQCIADDGERAIAQQIDFHQAGFFRLILFPLNHRHGFRRDLFRRRLDRDITPDLIRHDDDAAAMEREMPEMALGLNGEAEDLGPRRREFQFSTEAPRPVLSRRHVLEPQQIFLPQNPGRYIADLHSRHPVHLRDLANRGPESQAVLVRHHRGLALLDAIFLEDPLKNAVALVPRKINVDIRRIAAAGVQKPSKKQMVLDRVHMGDAQAVRDD